MVYADMSECFHVRRKERPCLGAGSLEMVKSHVYRIPLPPSLSGNLTWRRLTITLSWFTPIDSLDRFYRRAALWFVPPQEQLLVHRCQVESKMTQRGHRAARSAGRGASNSISGRPDDERASKLQSSVRSPGRTYSLRSCCDARGRRRNCNSHL